MKENSSLLICIRDAESQDLTSDDWLRHTRRIPETRASYSRGTHPSNIRQKDTARSLATVTCLHVSREIEAVRLAAVPLAPVCSSRLTTEGRRRSAEEGDYMIVMAFGIQTVLRKFKLHGFVDVTSACRGRLSRIAVDGGGLMVLKR